MLTFGAHPTLVQVWGPSTARQGTPGENQLGRSGSLSPRQDRVEHSGSDCTGDER